MTQESYTENELLAKAIAFAALKHGSQTRRNGEPYIYHPLKVAEIVKNVGYGIKFQIVAVLHDVLEDTDATEAEVREFGDDILEAVKLVTRPEGADEGEYVAAILKNHMAAVVKNADKIHNLWESVHPDKPGTRRTEEDIKFANRYIKKAKIYYYDKFSPALDVAIREADTELMWTTVRETNDSWTSGPEMELYIEEEAKRPQRETERKETLRKKYNDLIKRPDLANSWLCELNGSYYGETDMFNVWILTEAGWLPSSMKLFDWLGDETRLTPDEMQGIIEKKKAEGYFYDFVDPSRIWK